MATSSIKHNVVIDNDEVAQKLLNVLENGEINSNCEKTIDIKARYLSPEEIEEFFKEE